MDEDRLAISGELWERMWLLLPGKAGDPAATGRDNRRFIEAVLWRARTGSPWRDLPKDFGNWNSVFKRFRRWAKAGVFESLFNAINGEPDLEYAILMERSLRSTKRHRALKGDSTSSHRALSRWADDQNSRTGGCARELVSVFASARASTRYERGCAVDM